MNSFVMLYFFLESGNFEEKIDRTLIGQQNFLMTYLEIPFIMRKEIKRIVIELKFSIIYYFVNVLKMRFWGQLLGIH